MSDLQVAFAGYGAGGSIYNAPIVSSVEGLRVHSIWTRSIKNKSKAAEDFPGVHLPDDFSAIEQDPQIDLVLVMLPNHLHYEFAKRALLAGKHVLVEKPFTPSTREADELIALAKSKNLILSVHHNRRYDSDFRTLQRVIHEGLIGDVVLYEAHFDRYRNVVKQTWKENPELPGSGLLYDLGSHLIDQALCLFGLPDAVFADLRIQRPKAQVTDYFEILLYYPAVKLSLNAGMLVMEPGPKYSVHGTRGSFLKTGEDPQESLLKEGIRPTDSQEWGREPENHWGILTDSHGTRVYESLNGDYRKIYQDLKNAIKGEGPVPVSAEQARDVVRIIELCQASSESKSVVTL